MYNLSEVVSQRKKEGPYMSFIEDNMKSLLALMSPKEHTEDFVKYHVLPYLERWNKAGLYWHLYGTAMKRVEHNLGYYILPYPDEGLGLPKWHSEGYRPFIEAAADEMDERIAEIAVIPSGLTLEENAVEILQGAWSRIDEVVAEWFKKYFESRWAEQKAAQ